MRVTGKRTMRLAGAAMLGGLSLLCATTVSAHGASGHSGSGDSNRGDVWTDNVGQPAGPGHEQDPHLACTDINLWGSDMGDSSGAYTIVGQPPSGHQEVDYTSSWAYDTALGGTQVISVIDVSRLVSSATANGDTPQNKQGLHFKLDLSQDPQKHKTFWVSCAVPASGGPTPTPTPTTSPSPSPSASPSAGPVGGAAGAATPPVPSGSNAPAAGSGSGGSKGSAAAPAPASGVQAASAAPSSGVLGASTSTPVTGAEIAFGLAVSLLGGGAAFVAIAVRMRRRSSVES